jgi:dephospho-CoA kinase
MLMVGLTGGIACGKSTVAAMLREHGAPIIDADQLARDVVAPGSEGLEEIANAFGPEMITDDGFLDRKRMSALVFADAERRARLEAITHPRIFARFTALAQAHDAHGEPVVIYEAALLYERGLDQLMNAVIVVTVPAPVQLHRLRDREGIDEEEALRRITAQLSLEEKVKRADYVIDNSQSLIHTRAQLDYVWRQVMSRAVSSKGAPRG